MHIVSRMKKRVFIILIILKRVSFRQLLVCHCSNKKTPRRSVGGNSLQKDRPQTNCKETSVYQ